MILFPDRDPTGSAIQDGCQAKFLTCEISDFTPCAHAQNDILHMKYIEKTDD